MSIATKAHVYDFIMTLSKEGQHSSSFDNTIAPTVHKSFVQKKQACICLRDLLLTVVDSVVSTISLLDFHY